MTPKTSLVLTSISAPNPALRSLSAGAQVNHIDFIVIGDEKSPQTFDLKGCRFVDLVQQRKLGFSFAETCPTHHYSRKNIGYLLALRDGAEIIIETDDDNFPRDEFWNKRERLVQADPILHSGWINAYKYFTDEHIWPRGLPLDEILKAVPRRADSSIFDCPIQQGLADKNPDVDAIYRLTLPLPQSFRNDKPIVLTSGAWCPFNSQNTTWFRDAAPLMYLPTFCSFRMTDIWRGFIAQRIAWECDWSVSFHAPTVWQERNEHNLMKDFQDEVSGYLHNSRIAGLLAGLKLAKGADNIPANLLVCYEALICAEIFKSSELLLVSAWLKDLEAVL